MLLPAFIGFSALRFSRKRSAGTRSSAGGRSSAPVDWLIVGLGNPGAAYTGTRHNIGFVVCAELVARFELGKAKDKFSGRFVDGRLGPGGSRVAVLTPLTYMNESGRSVGPARGALKVDPGRVVVVHDDIDLPFGRIETRLGGGTAGHNGLKSIKSGLGTAEFQRVRVGVGRPDSTDPEIVSAYVLGKFSESRGAVDQLVADAVDASVALVGSELADGS